MRNLVIALIFLCSCSQHKIPVLETGSLKPMPNEWIDKETGHKVVRLTGMNADNRSFYFHNNPFIPSLKGEGDLMVFYSSKQERKSDHWYKGKEVKQLYTINLKTYQLKQLTNVNTSILGEIVAKKRREVFYQSNDSVFAVNVDNQKSRLVFVFPDSIHNANISTLNAGENLLAGVFSSSRKDSILKNNPKKSDYFRLIYEAKLPHTLFTLDIDKGKINYIFSDTAWINHVQFSPADPDLLMFCHEGPWHLVNRIWLINTDKKIPMLMHHRSVKNEIAGHEFFSIDGNTVWYDLQIPKGQTFYLGGTDKMTRFEMKFPIRRNDWSIHFAQSPDKKTFAGDGGDPSQVAKAKNGMWINLFHLYGDSLIAQKLVNMKRHNYQLEPNVHYSPDGKWIIFRANFEGTSQIYAVKIEKG
jgi:oligogalacturonide lyase